MKKDELRELVREKYANVITGKNGCCGGSGCCGSNDRTTTNVITNGLYAANEVEGLPQEMLNASLGCGNPTALGALYPGETALDLGSGAGLDVLLSARRVGPYGKAYGLDMTDEMLAEANVNKAKAQVTNAEFLKGHIEDIPLPNGMIDVVISNCVINLSVDKDQVFKEIYRVLKPGGRMAVSDIVTSKPLPDRLRQNLLSWAGCISGALLDEEYKKKLAEAGFENIELEITRTYNLTDPSIQRLIPELANEDNEWNGALVSAFIRAKKPAQFLIEGKDFSIKLAEQDDFLQIHEILHSNGLPVGGVNTETGEYFIAASGQSIMGIIGFESYVTAALMRSLAVKPQFRKSGIARNLIEHVLKVLRRDGFNEVYLLTNTAEKYFNRYGFNKINRQDVPDSVLETSALGDACPMSSTCMCLKL